MMPAGIWEDFLDRGFAYIDAHALFAGIHAKPDGELHRAVARRFPVAIYCDLTDEIALS